MAYRVLDVGHIGEGIDCEYLVGSHGGNITTSIEELSSIEMLKAMPVLFNGQEATEIWIDDFDEEDADTLADQLDGYGYSTTVAACEADPYGQIQEAVNHAYLDNDAAATGVNVFERTYNILQYGGKNYIVWKMIHPYDDPDTYYALMSADMAGVDLYNKSLLANGTNCFCPFEIVLVTPGFVYDLADQPQLEKYFKLLFCY